MRLSLLIIAILLGGGCESALVRQVSHLEQVRNDAAAVEMLEQEVQQNPGNAESLYHLGRLYCKTERYVAGREALAQAMKLSDRFDERAQYELDSHLNLRLKTGLDAFNGGAYEEAVQQFRYATEVGPSSAVAFKGLGNAQYKNGQFDEAEAAYRSAAELDVEDIHIRLNIAELALRRSDYPGAIQYAQEVLTLAPGHPEGTQRLAYAAMLGGRYELADSAFVRYLAMPAGTYALRDYAFMNFNAGRYEVAIPHILELVNQGDADGKLRFMLGEAYFALDRYDEMASVYKNLSEQFPQNVYALQGLIIAHERLGNIAETLGLQTRLKALQKNE